MREWLMRAVLKTAVPQGTVGSNPTPSAMSCLLACARCFHPHRSDRASVPKGSAKAEFVGLRNGDTLWIEYESSGCFHSYRADLTLYGREPNLAHLEVWNFGILGRTDGPVGRTVRLTDEDLGLLDSLVASYQMAPTEISSGVDRITFTSSRKGRRSALHFARAYPPLELQVRFNELIFER